MVYLSKDFFVRKADEVRVMPGKLRMKAATASVR